MIQVWTEYLYCCILFIFVPFIPPNAIPKVKGLFTQPKFKWGFICKDNISKFISSSSHSKINWNLHYAKR